MYLQNYKPPIDSSLVGVQIDCSPDQKLVIFDLDETLVHCFDPSDFDTENFEILTDYGECIRCSVNVRPHALECLKQA